MVAVLAGAAPAFASDNDGDITTAVTAQQTSVTQTTASVTTYASFRITLTHYTTRSENIGPITVVLTTTVDGLASPVAPVVGLSAPAPAGTSCPTPGPGSATMTCTTTLLSTPGQSVSFDVTVAAPASGSQVSLSASTSWKESGESGTESGPTVTASMGLDVPDPNKLNSFVPASTAPTTLFPNSADCVTGPTYIGCAATSSQTWTTTVEIPPSSQTTTAQILQEIVPGGCASNLLTCSSSTLTIPGAFDHLVITLRRDTTTIGKKAKIGSAIITYEAPAHPNPLVVYPLQVPACTDTTYGVLPQAGIPCIKLRTAYTKKSDDDDHDHASKSSAKTSTIPPEFQGDWEFVIWALDNGKYNN